MYTYTTIQMTRAGQPVTVFCCNDTYADWICERGATKALMTYTAPEEGQAIETIEESPEYVHTISQTIDDIQTFGVIMESFNR